MNLVLQLSPELEAKLCEQAKAVGLPPEDVALAALVQSLQSMDDETPPLSSDQWRIQFESWVRSHRSRNPLLDDSRESIYPDG